MKMSLRVFIAMTVLLSLCTCSRNDDMAQLKEMAERGERSYKLYRTGDYATAKAALFDYIQYLEGNLADPSFRHIETARIDIFLNYVRLAKLEENNNGPDKETYMAKAVAMCEQVKKDKKCEEADLRAFADGIDRAVPK